MDTLYSILLPSFLFFLWLGSIVATAIGIGLIVFPMHTVAVNEYLSRWIDTDGIAAELNRPRWTERFFYRNHRLAGGLSSLGGAYVLYTFLLTPLPRKISDVMVDDLMGIWDSILAMLIIGNVLAVLIGALVFARPSLIREIEQAANRWISVDFISTFFNRMDLTVDQYVIRNKKVVGLFLALAGLYAVVELGRLLLAGNWKLLLW